MDDGEDADVGVITWHGAAGSGYCRRKERTSQPIVGGGIDSCVE
jgi:hypothetical protein